LQNKGQNHLGFQHIEIHAMRVLAPIPKGMNASGCFEAGETPLEKNSSIEFIHVVSSWGQIMVNG
jgi:hypothetical protein